MAIIFVVLIPSRIQVNRLYMPGVQFLNQTSKLILRLRLLKNDENRQLMLL